MSSQQQQAAAAAQAPWLGLLKWSLNYMDGTVPSEESEQYRSMSEEDKKFLESVMKDGIVDEGDRMKTILKELISYLDSLGNGYHQNLEEEETTTQPKQNNTQEDVEELLLELQDIVEQIDFAKSFASMGGLSFLLGCAGATSSSMGMEDDEKEKMDHENDPTINMTDDNNNNRNRTPTTIIVPTSIRASCLGILATLCQNNPSVQMMMLEQGGVVKLIDIFFDTALINRQQQQQHSSTDWKEEQEEGKEDGDADSVMIMTKTIQAMSSFIRNHDMAEKIFCLNSQGLLMIQVGLGMYTRGRTISPSTSSSVGVQYAITIPSSALRRRALFFLQALVTSDSADSDRVKLLKPTIQFVASNLLDIESTNGEVEEQQQQGSDSTTTNNPISIQNDNTIREMALSMLNRILEQKKSVDGILDLKNSIVAMGVRRVTTLRSITEEEEKEMVQEEIQLWETLITNLAQAVRDDDVTTNSEMLLLGDGSAYTPPPAQ